MYIKSKDIKVFPSSFRDNSIDAASCLMTEENIKSLKTLSDDDTLKSYFTYQLINNIYKFNLTLLGYNFVFDVKSADLLEAFGENATIYASIKLVLSSNGFSTLIGANSSGISILDTLPTNNTEEENEDKIFEGLLLTTSTDSEHYSIKLGEIVDGVITINSDKTCKLNKSEILDVLDNTNDIQYSIDEQFHTDLLGTEGQRIPNAHITNEKVNLITVDDSGDVKRFGKSAIVPDYSGTSQLQPTNYSVLAIKDGELEWLDPYLGDYEII